MKRGTRLHRLCLGIVTIALTVSAFLLPATSRGAVPEDILLRDNVNYTYHMQLFDPVHVDTGWWPPEIPPGFPKFAQFKFKVDLGSELEYEMEASAVLDVFNSRLWFEPVADGGSGSVNLGLQVDCSAKAFIRVTELPLGLQLALEALHWTGTFDDVFGPLGWEWPYLIFEFDVLTPYDGRIGAEGKFDPLLLEGNADRPFHLEDEVSEIPILELTFSQILEAICMYVTGKPCPKVDEIAQYVDMGFTVLLKPEVTLDLSTDHIDVDGQQVTYEGEKIRVPVTGGQMVSYQTQPQGYLVPKVEIKLVPTLFVQIKAPLVGDLYTWRTPDPDIPPISITLPPSQITFSADTVSFVIPSVVVRSNTAASYQLRKLPDGELIEGTTEPTDDPKVFEKSYVTMEAGEWEITWLSHEDSWPREPVTDTKTLPETGAVLFTNNYIMRMPSDLYQLIFEPIDYATGLFSAHVRVKNTTGADNPPARTFTSPVWLVVKDVTFTTAGPDSEGRLWNADGITSALYPDSPSYYYKDVSDWAPLEPGEISPTVTLQFYIKDRNPNFQPVIEVWADDPITATGTLPLVRGVLCQPPGSILLRWKAEAGSVAVVEAADSPAGPWTEASSGILCNGGLAEWNSAMPKDVRQRFYRVRTVSP